MIKKLLLAVLIAMPAMVSAQKFGTINTADLMQNLPEMKEIQTQLEASSAKYDSEYKNLADEMQKKYDEFQKLSNDATVPDAIKERRIQEIQELDQKIQQFRTTASQDLQRQQEQLMAPVQQKVISAIQSVGAEGGYTFIFENTNPIYSGKDVIDVTSAVKAKLGIK